MNSPTVRFAFTAALIAAAAIFLHAHWGNEVFPSRLPLKSFPMQIGNWQGTDVRDPPSPIPKDRVSDDWFPASPTGSTPGTPHKSVGPCSSAAF